ncbi:MAG TPA: YlbE-like family protein [Bacillota bacterium]|nr:YlbE-like family protein [Bacillota bacterium]
MDAATYQYLLSKPELLHFIRQEPVWYRYLSRDPDSLALMEKEAKIFFGKTVSQRLGKMNRQVQMVHMLLQLANAMKD